MLWKIWDHFLTLLFPKDSEYWKSLEIGLREVGGKKTFKRSEQMKKKNSFRCGAFQPFVSKNVQIWDHFFSLFFNKEFQISKKFGHWTLRSGGTKTVKLSEKVWWTKKPTNMLTSRLIESIGPEGRCFENLAYRRHWLPQLMGIEAPIPKKNPK